MSLSQKHKTADVKQMNTFSQKMLDVFQKCFLKKKCSRVSAFSYCKWRNDLYAELCRKSVSVYRVLEKDGDQLDRSGEELKGVMWGVGRKQHPTSGKTGNVRINVTLRRVRPTKVAVGKQ